MFNTGAGDVFLKESHHHRQLKVTQKGDHTRLLFFKANLSHQDSTTGKSQISSTDPTGNASLCSTGCIISAYKVLLKAYGALGAAVIS